MTAKPRSTNARWWIIFTGLAALICLGLAAINTFAAAPTGAPDGKAPSAAPKPGSVGASSPLTCSNNYTYTTSAGNAIDPGTTLVPGSQADDAVQNVALPFTFYYYGTAYNS